ncbi:ATP-dependent 3'-5' DNA helicase [Cytospora paraplurivora]|uniref:ATP-dependent 3'-5' DNA helicase n=1 Tax=Cytospora paraplurivora TaxID=2898453 RepID=A0AAN9YFR7_9PEZI
MPGPPLHTRRGGPGRGKRKRSVALPEATDPSVPIEPEPACSPGERSGSPPVKVEDDGAEDTPQAAPKAPKSRRGPPKTKKPALKKSDSSSAGVRTLKCVIEWPDYFKALEKTHRALNLVFTFCCTRKHLATTFDTIRSAVESHTKRELLVADVAAVVALRPDGINFGYVDEVMLQIDAKGAERSDAFVTGGRGRGFRAQGFAPDASVGGITGTEPLGARGHPDDDHGGVVGGKEVLYFEFVDGDLKRQVQHRKTGEPTKPTRKLREEDLKMPVYSQQQMAGLIEKRNSKFASAVNEYINRCVAQNLDPEVGLRSEAEKYIPAPSEETGDSRPELSNTLPDTIPKERKSVPEIVQELKNSPWYTGQIVPDGHRVFEAQEAVYGELNFLLSQDLVNALYNAKGITQFFAHQTEAINSLHDGHHVVVSTSTSSGKSLIYQLPVLHALEQDPNTRAMYIFPTKALAQDQKRSLRDMLSYLPGLEHTLVDTFDGDTPWKERNTIRDEARIIFTNPDMLHITILPQEERWRTFLQNLKYVVVDELHYYNGLMGSHVAFIMRRLRRICAAVGNNKVRFVSCSATVANPQEHFRTIFGIEDVHLVDFDGSPSGRKEFLCWNTPFKDPGDPTSGRGNAMYECARLFCQLILRGVRVIGFCRVREQCEKLVGAVKHELERLGRGDCVNRVMGYRGGYTPQDRRRIETEMFEGKLMGIIATTALELGVDIGSLDAVLTWGFPYTISNLRQQSGRAGRRNKDSLSILVGDCFPTDQHYMQNPDELFTKPNCELQVDLDNMLVREGHIQCAAYEMPIRPTEDAKYLGQDIEKLCEERLIKDELGFYHTHDRFRPLPSKFVSIRDTEDEHFAIIDVTHGRNIVLEELEASRATFTIYDGAIFLHQGTTYLVRDFDPDRRMARVEKVKVDWTTQQRDFTDVDPIETEAIRRIKGSASRAFHGTIRITQVVFGYFKVDRRNRVLDAVHVDNPPVVRLSKGMWIDLPKPALDVLDSRRMHVAAAIHAAEHAVMSLVPNFVLSVPGDVRTECKNSLKEFARVATGRKRPARLTFYDAKGGAGGSGINTKAFEFVDLLLGQALRRVGGCPCASGCPECVASEFCKEANEVMSKAGAEVILKSLLGVEIDVDALPMGPEEGWNGRAELIETVVLATPVPPRNRGALRVVDVKEEEGGGDGGVLGGIPEAPAGDGDSEGEGDGDGDPVGEVLDD